MAIVHHEGKPNRKLATLAKNLIEDLERSPNENEFIESWIYPGEIRVIIFDDDLIEIIQINIKGDGKLQFKISSNMNGAFKSSILKKSGKIGDALHSFVIGSDELVDITTENGYDSNWFRPMKEDDLWLETIMKSKQKIEVRSDKNSRLERIKKLIKENPILMKRLEDA